LLLFEVFQRDRIALDLAGSIAVAARNVGLVRPRAVVPVVAMLPDVSAAFEAVRAVALDDAGLVDLLREEDCIQCFSPAKTVA